jgi:hypothetical protein
MYILWLLFRSRFRTALCSIGSDKASEKKVLLAYLLVGNRDRWYDFKNIFAEKFSEKNGVFYSKQSKIILISYHCFLRKPPIFLGKLAKIAENCDRNIDEKCFWSNFGAKKIRRWTEVHWKVHLALRSIAKSNPTIVTYEQNQRRKNLLQNAVCCSNLKYIFFYPGANPTIASYNASVVNFYYATGSLARFENKNILFYFEKRWSCSCKFKNRRIGSCKTLCPNWPSKIQWSSSAGSEKMSWDVALSSSATWTNLGHSFIETIFTACANELAQGELSTLYLKPSGR